MGRGCQQRTQCSGRRLRLPLDGAVNIGCGMVGRGPFCRQYLRATHCEQPIASNRCEQRGLSDPSQGESNPPLLCYPPSSSAPRPPATPPTTTTPWPPPWPPPPGPPPPPPPPLLPPQHTRGCECCIIDAPGLGVHLAVLHVFDLDLRHRAWRASGGPAAGGGHSGHLSLILTPAKAPRGARV